MSEPPPRRLCVLADPYLADHRVRALEQAVDEAAVSVSLVLVNQPESMTSDPEKKASAVNDSLGTSTLRYLFDVISRERWWTLPMAEKKISEELGSRPAEGMVPVDDVSLFRDAEVRRVSPVQDGNWNEIPAEMCARVADHSDVAIRYGFGLIRGDVLTAPEFGVLGFHPADIRRYRGLGAPLAFLDGCDQVGMTLQRLNDRIDGGEIVAYGEVDLDDRTTLWELYDRLYAIRGDLLADGIRRLRDPSESVITLDSLGPYNSIRKRRTMTFASRVLAKDLSVHVRRTVS